MPGLTNVPGVEVWGKGRGEFDLPCGFVDAEGKVFKNIVLREMTGVEEDMMDDDELSRTGRITNVLSACIERLGNIENPEAIRQIVSDTMPVGKGITSSDRIAALIFLRRVSVGNIYRFERRCPRCGHVNKNRQLDLTKLTMREVPPDRVPKRRVKVKLPRTQQPAIIRVLTATHEDQLLRLRPNQKDLRTAAMAARVEAIGETVFQDAGIAMATLKGLPQADRVFIREVYDMIEADVDTEVEVQCDSSICNAEWAFALDLGQAFFSNAAPGGVTEETLEWL